MKHPKKSFKEKAHRQRVEKRQAARRDKRKAAARGQRTVTNDIREARRGGTTLSRMLKGFQANKRGTGSALKQKKVKKLEAEKAAFEAVRKIAQSDMAKQLDNIQLTTDQFESVKGSPQP